MFVSEADKRQQTEIESKRTGEAEMNVKINQLNDFRGSRKPKPKPKSKPKRKPNEKLISFVH